MHEVGIATEILKIIEDRAKEHGDGAVRVIRLRIGELSGVAAESLRFALEVCSKGTRCEAMAVEITPVPVNAKCRACGYEWEFSPGDTQCSICDSYDVALNGGDEMHVESFEME